MLLWLQSFENENAMLANIAALSDRFDILHGKTYPSPAVWSEESQQKARDTFASPKFRKEIETLGEYDREITLGFFNEINAEAHKSSAIIEKSLDQKVLEVAAEKIRDLSDKYLKFAAENPLLAEYGLSAFSIAAQTALAGLAGLVKSTATEITARAAGYLTAEQIASFISDRRADVGAKLQKSYPQMEANNIEALAAAIVLGPVLVAFGAMGAKQLINDISTIAGKLNPNRFAIAGGKGVDGDEFFSHFDDASSHSSSLSNSEDLAKLSLADMQKQGFKSFRNYEAYIKYKMDGAEEWVVGYNKFLKEVEITNVGTRSTINEHHIISNKGEASDAFRNHDLFSEGVLDVKILDDKRNIMVLPTKEGMHPTMTVHPGGRHTSAYKFDMNRELTRIYNAHRGNLITKAQAEQQFWDVVAKERVRLYHGQSNIYKKK